jgi:hypothetical protein
VVATFPEISPADFSHSAAEIRRMERLLGKAKPITLTINWQPPAPKTAILFCGCRWSGARGFYRWCAFHELTARAFWSQVPAQERPSRWR